MAKTAQMRRTWDPKMPCLICNRPTMVALKPMRGRVCEKRHNVVRRDK
jgi:hypothetical protein